MDKDKQITELKELLSCCLEEVCQLCVRLNPQHKDCKQCDGTDQYREAIK